MIYKSNLLKVCLSSNFLPCLITISFVINQVNWHILGIHNDRINIVNLFMIYFDFSFFPSLLPSIQTNSSFLPCLRFVSILFFFNLVFLFSPFLSFFPHPNSSFFLNNLFSFHNIYCIFWPCLLPSSYDHYFLFRYLQNFSLSINV